MILRPNALVVLWFNVMIDVAHARRIHIVGGAGSGKTTLAQAISAELNIPICIDLDTVAYENGNGAPRPLEVRLADVETIVANEAYVTEGIYVWFSAELMQQADLIIWLDLPIHIAMGRIITRHIKKSLAGNNPHPGLGKLYNFLHFQYTRFYHGAASDPASDPLDFDVTRETMAATLSHHQHKLIHCQRPHDVTQLLQIH